MGQAPSREDGFGQPSAQPGAPQRAVRSRRGVPSQTRVAPAGEGASSGEGASTALVGQGSASLPGEETVVPTVLQWSHGGNSVYVTGSFNNWGERIPMRRSGNDCVVCLNLLPGAHRPAPPLGREAFGAPHAPPLPRRRSSSSVARRRAAIGRARSPTRPPPRPGTYQYKFIVDNEWRYAPEQPTVRDELGNVNNCVAVEDQSAYMREDPQSGFFNDTYPNMYSQVTPPRPAAQSLPRLSQPLIAVARRRSRFPTRSRWQRSRRRLLSISGACLSTSRPSRSRASPRGLCTRRSPARSRTSTWRDRRPSRCSRWRSASARSLWCARRARPVTRAASPMLAVAADGLPSCGGRRW